MFSDWREGNILLNEVVEFKTVKNQQQLFLLAGKYFLVTVSPLRLYCLYCKIYMKDN